jgi:hypothetical protein
LRSHTVLTVTLRKISRRKKSRRVHSKFVIPVINLLFFSVFFDILVCSDNSQSMITNIISVFFVSTMSLLYRAFGRVQDTVTRAIYGVEKRTNKMSFYSCVDTKINGDNITVRIFRHCLCLIVSRDFNPESILILSILIAQSLNFEDVGICR